MDYLFSDSCFHTFHPTRTTNWMQIRLNTCCGHLSCTSPGANYREHKTQRHHGRSNPSVERHVVALVILSCNLLIYFSLHHYVAPIFYFELDALGCLSNLWLWLVCICMLLQVVLNVCFIFWQHVSGDLYWILCILVVASPPLKPELPCETPSSCQ